MLRLPQGFRNFKLLSLLLLLLFISGLLTFQDIQKTPVAPMVASVVYRAFWPFLILSNAMEKSLKSPMKPLPSPEGDPILNQSLFIKEVTLENQRLRNLLELKRKLSSETIPIKTIAAEVIGREPGNFFSAVFLDKGSEEGVMPKMVVIGHNGLVGQLVGQVVETHLNMSKVLLITDSNSKVGVFLQKSRAQGVLQGRDGKDCIIKYIDSQWEIEEGELVFTSGLGGVFPKGLSIGKVEKVKKERAALFSFIQVIPWADLARLEEVLIVLPPSPSGKEGEG